MDKRWLWNEPCENSKWTTWFTSSHLRSPTQTASWNSALYFSSLPSANHSSRPGPHELHGPIVAQIPLVSRLWGRRPPTIIKHGIYLYAINSSHPTGVWPPNYLASAIKFSNTCLVLCQVFPGWNELKTVKKETKMTITKDRYRTGY